MSLLLTTEERRRFAEHCEMSSMSCEAIADQLGKLSGMDMLVAREMHKAIAYKTVARELRSAEEQTIR